MYGTHQPWRGWDLRLTGDVFGQLVYEPTERHRTGGDDTIDVSSVNWGMVMLRRSVGRGRFGVRGMVSADRWTTSGCGPINLLATGEICRGDTVHDRQQPHDFAMELAADFERPIRGNWRWQLYAGIAGEPALGPPGYAHRTSAGVNSTSPVSHHLIDPPTSFGVLTAGIHNQKWKFEASAFNGRSADESRVDIDFGALDSAAARLSWLPTDRLSLQVSVGRVHEAAAEFVGQREEAASRLIASGSYHRPLSDSGLWATTVAYGLVEGRDIIAGSLFDIVSDGLLIETAVTRFNTHTFFGRAEVVAMPAHHLHAHEYIQSVFTTGKVQAGYVRHFGNRRGVTPGLGASMSVSILPTALAPRYYGNFSPGWTVFLNLRPAPHEM
jgi:hypothetical protein